MKKLTTKVLSTILSIIFVLSSIMCIGSVTTSAASAPVYTIKSVTNLTHNNAKISARITNPAKTTITKVGFQMGTAKNKLTINKYDSVKMKTSYVDASYLMSKYKVTLKANTTYYYRFYMVTGGKTTYSAVNSFKTSPVQTPKFTVNKVTGVTYNNATISARITNPAKTTITKVGFQMGTSKSNLTINKYDSVSLKTSYVDASYLMSKYKVTLAAGKTYYYKFYMVTGGKTYYSTLNSFVTPEYNVATYPQIKSLSVSRIEQQEKNSCYISSFATAYAYINKGSAYRVGGNDIAQTDAVYKEIRSYNGGVSMQDKTLTKYGFKKTSYNLETIYNSLKSGKPVVVYYNNGKGYGHASVIIGYNGSTTKLEESGFIVMEINQDDTYGSWKNSKTLFSKHSNTPHSNIYTSCYLQLNKWCEYVNNQYGGNLCNKVLCVSK